MKKFKHKGKHDRIKISDSDRAEVWKFIKKHEKEIKLEAIQDTQVIMLAAFAEWYAKKHHKLTTEELETFGKDVIRYCGYVENGLVSVDEIREIFNKYSEEQLNGGRK